MAKEVPNFFQAQGIFHIVRVNQNLLNENNDVRDLFL